jgi:hypothetical protein
MVTMPKDSPDPMRYLPTPEEQREAYDHEPRCHHPECVERELLIERLEAKLHE